MRPTSPTSNRKYAKSAGATGVWWLHPTAIVFGFLIPAYLLIWIFGLETDGRLSTAKGYFYLKGNVAWLGLLGLAVLGIGTTSPIYSKHNSGAQRYLNVQILTALGILSLAGYLYWFKDFVIRPQLIFDAIGSSTSVSYAIRGNLDRPAGISSLAQLGLPYLIGYTYLLWAPGTVPPSKFQQRLFWGILIAIGFRAFAWAERVAVIEALVAVAFVWASFQAARLPTKLRLALMLFPFIGGTMMVLLFAAGEYFRSWSSHYVNTEKSFWSFILQRLANYYFNALNTGAGRLTTLEWPTYDFLWTLRWLHKLPFVGPVFSYWTGAKGDSFLDRYGDPEFNNPSGVFSIYLDVGTVGALLLFLMIGVFSKYFYMSWRTGQRFVGAFYFVFLMTLLEFFRYFYLGDSRSFMVLVGLMVLLSTTRKAKHD